MCPTSNSNVFTSDCVAEYVQCYGLYYLLFVKKE